MNTKTFKFIPFSIKQKQVLTWWTKESPHHKKDAIIADGAVRSGKSLIMSLSYIIWSMSEFNRCNFGMAGKTVGSFKRNVWFLLKVMLRGRGYSIKKLPELDSPNAFVISKNGIENYYYIFGGNDERSQDLVQGFTAAGFFFDEVVLQPKSFVNQACARCSVDGAKLWFNCNPQGPFHWFKLEWIDKAKELNALYLHFTMDDNPSLSKETIARYARLFSGVFFRRYILGLWVIAEGIIYDMFNPSIHIVKDYNPTEVINYEVGIDYGTGNPTAFILTAFRKSGKALAIKEYYWDSRKEGRQKTDAEYSQDLRAFLGDIHPTKIWVDPSAASFILQLKRDGFYNIKQADNSVLDGIRNVGRLLQERLLEILEGQCPNLEREMQSYSWDPKAAERGEDKPIKENDHACDALRYVLVNFGVKLRIGTINVR